MKKLLPLLLILLALSAPAFADGVTPIGGGRTCDPQTQVCSPPSPEPNEAPDGNSDAEDDAQSDDPDSPANPLDFLLSLFG